jgi:hypothetical protein
MQEEAIAKYTVHLFCVDCWQLHKLAAGIEIHEQTEKFAKLKDVWDGKQILAPIVILLSQPVTCPATKMQKTDPERVYIIRQ